jgi:hypothetical protein
MIIQASLPGGSNGPDLDLTPVDVGGRERMSLNFETIGLGGTSAGLRGM